MSPASRAILTLLILTLGYFPALPARSAQPLRPGSFGLRPPAHLSRLVRKSIWFTDYVDYLVDEDVAATAVPLVNTLDQPLDVSANHAQWCKAADEGTVTVRLTGHGTRSFNFDGRASREFTDCSDVFSHLASAQIEAINRSAFVELPADAPFRLGTNGYRLVPNRSIAADLSGSGIFHAGDVLYVPRLRGMNVTLQNARSTRHDGYVMVADKVSACRKDMPADCNRNHLDYFSGRSRSDVLPVL